MPSSRSGKPKRKRNQKQKRLKAFKRRLEQGPLHEMPIFINPKREVKMSEVLTDFARPYREKADTEESYRRLLTLAMVAWNASFLPEDKRQEMVDRILNEGIPTATEELKAGLRNIVTELIKRKEDYFPNYTQKIVEFELTDRGRNYHLSVASVFEEISS